MMTVRTSTSAQPTMYYYTQKTTVVDPTACRGADCPLLRPDMPVSYTYAKEGDRMVVTKDDAAKAAHDYYEKTTTTTTTTNP